MTLDIQTDLSIVLLIAVLAITFWWGFRQYRSSGILRQRNAILKRAVESAKQPRNARGQFTRRAV